MKKRSISLYGHQTSVALEAEFWAVIDEAVAASGESFASFIRTRDDERMEGGPTRNLASHLRVWCLKHASHKND
ncbi:MAG: ribbon-helix-helix domain-containing protein [Litorimonas sp.]